jgi:acyl-CoA thioesterase
VERDDTLCPVPSPDRDTDGLSYVRGQIGVEPRSDFARTLGLRVLSADFGVAVVGVSPEPGHLNVGGTVHGGFLSALMDYATGLAVMTTLPPGHRGVHAQASYSFLRGALADRALSCRATCPRTPRSVGHIRCEVHDDAMELIATGTSVIAVVPFSRGSGP